MSRRISFKSEIRDKDLAINALKSLNYGYRDAGESLVLTSGPLNRATIDLRSGEVVSDSDWHDKSALGGLRQAYSEAEIQRQIHREGATIESRSVNAAGQIKILCRMTG